MAVRARCLLAMMEPITYVSASGSTPGDGRILLEWESCGRFACVYLYPDSARDTVVWGEDDRKTQSEELCEMKLEQTLRCL